MVAATRRCSFVQLSVDGDEADHDFIRGVGAFQGAMRAMGALAARGVAIHVNMVMTRRNSGKIVDAAKRILETYPVQRLRINPVDTDLEEFRPTAVQLAENMVSLREVAKAHRGVVHGGLFRLLKAIRRPDDFPESCNDLLGADCAVRFDGSIIPCINAVDQVMGNVKDGHFLELWLHSEKWQEFRGAPLPSWSTPEKCRACPYLRHCNPSCKAGRMAEKYCLREIREALPEELRK